MDRSHVVRFLPEVISRTIWPGGPLEALCEAMVTLLDPVDRRLSQLERYFDSYWTPDAMLPYLATWVDLGWLVAREGMNGEEIPPDRLRQLIGMAAFFANRRGTAEGLETMLRVATGVAGIRVLDSTADPSITQPFHLVVQLPKAAQSSQQLVELIVRFEKPAHLTHEIVPVNQG
jgi:phage tail-like protein